jgi:DNA-binding response OmpR family regulator
MDDERKKILIIDDNEDIIVMLKAILSMKGYEVYLKRDVDDITEYVTKLWPDLIIMDMLLSGIDGCEICNSLKSDTKFDSISVLMISAHPHAREACLKVGADKFLGKPFDLKNFFKVVEELLLIKKNQVGNR